MFVKPEKVWDCVKQSTFLLTTDRGFLFIHVCFCLVPVGIVGGSGWVGLEEIESERYK